mmetsp:Transcript_23794/g.34667  ORF Transcript_23794/g.34667 Transcript_23794/m.34667 type:complete len:82 (-) Transcript_23794:538-783(-)
MWWVKKTPYSILKQYTAPRRKKSCCIHYIFLNEYTREKVFMFAFVTWVGFIREMNHLVICATKQMAQMQTLFIPLILPSRS